MIAGQFSAAKIGTVEALVPMPIPIRIRVTRSCCQVWLRPDPMTEKRQKIPAMKIVARRPRWKLRGSDNQQPKRAAARYGAALMNPTIHGSMPVSREIPNASGKDKFAPFEPV